MCAFSEDIVPPFSQIFEGCVSRKKRRTISFSSVEAQQSLLRMGGGCLEEHMCGVPPHPLQATGSAVFQ